MQVRVHRACLGWLFDSSAGVQSRMVFNDELDELTHSPFTRSLVRVWLLLVLFLNDKLHKVYDVSDLQQPKLLDVFVSKMPATDHNNCTHSMFFVRVCAHSATPACRRAFAKRATVRVPVQLCCWIARAQGRRRQQRYESTRLLLFSTLFLCRSLARGRVV